MLQTWGQKSLTRYDYNNKITQFKKLLSEKPLDAHLVEFNIAQSYFFIDSFLVAESNYLGLMSRLPDNWKAIAANNLGVIALATNRNEEAVDFFKTALKSNSTSIIIQRNYELAVKRTKRKSPPPLINDDLPQPQPTISPNPPKPTENIKTSVDFKPQTLDEAEQIYIVLKNKEKQFIQQLRKGIVNPTNQTEEPMW